MKKLFILAAMSGVALFLVNGIALLRGWYDHVPFFDKWMHFFGGVFVYIALSAFLYRYRNANRFAFSLVLPIFLVIGVGLLWEVYEYVIQTITGAQLLTIPDSIGDLVADTVGAIVVAGVFFFVQVSKRRYNTINAN